MSHFIRYVQKRIEDNKNFLCSITGQTGSGKSYSALRLAEVLDPNFSLDQVAFNPREFMKILQSGHLKSGSVVVFDEAGVGMSHREWQSVGNRLINFVLQTFRHKNYIVLFTTPHMGFIDASSRKLFHCHMETVGINKKDKVCRLKPLLLQINQRKGDVYFKYLRVLIPSQGVVPLKRISVPLPSPALRKEYEEEKTAYTSALNQEILEELEEKHKGKQGKLTPRQQEVVDLLCEGYTVDAISDGLDIHQNSVYAHIKAVENKGWRVNPVKDGAQVLSYEVVEP